MEEIEPPSAHTPHAASARAGGVRGITEAHALTASLERGDGCVRNAALVQMRSTILPNTEKAGYIFLPVASSVPSSHERRDMLHPSPMAAKEMFSFALQFLRDYQPS